MALLHEIINRNAYFALERASYSQVHERVPSQSLVLLSMTTGLASAIVMATAIILLTSNITTINAQQFTNQPGEVIQNGTTTVPMTLFESRNDSFRVQVPEDWVIDDVNNTGSALSQETTHGYGILAELCPEEEEGAQQQQQALTNDSSSTSTCQQQQQTQDQIIHIIRYPNLGTRLGITLDEIRNITIPDSILQYQIQKLREVGYRNINIVNSTDTTINLYYNTTEGVPFPEAILPARVVEMTYSTSSAPTEMKRGYILLTATNVTPPNLQAITGYGIFYEGAPGATAATAAEQTTTQSGNLSLSAPRQVFDSFELIISEEAAQVILGSITQQAAGNEPTDQEEVDTPTPPSQGAEEEGDGGGDTPTPPSQ